MSISRQVTSNFLALLGAVAGGCLGYYTFQWIYHQGYYGMMVPGALLGLGAGLLGQDRSVIRGLVCGVAGLVLGLYTEWRFFPFKDDDSLGYFLRHLPEVIPIHLLMIGLGGFFAYWLGKDSGIRVLSGSNAVAGRGDGP